MTRYVLQKGKLASLYRQRVIGRRLTITYLILERLAELGEAVLDSFFPAKYPEARLWRGILGLDRSYSFNKRSFAVLLSRLKSKGLVERSRTAAGPGGWRITPHGKKLISTFSRTRRMPQDGVQRLVIFDIPEKERKKRDALRVELVAAGYRQLQKSVWLGAEPLPQDFLQLIHALDLLGCIHIFSVRDSGTLER